MPSASALLMLGSDVARRVVEPESPGMAAETIFEIIPGSAGKPLLLILIVFSVCFGAVTMELINHNSFDIRLIRKPGWTHPAKCVSHLAYFGCRLLAPSSLLMLILFLSLKFDECRALPWAFNIVAVLLFGCIVLVFMQRTMALYGWKSKVVRPLIAHYIMVVLAGAVAVPWYQRGTRIADTRFCTYESNRNATKLLVTLVLYKVLWMGLDIVMFLLTLNRLLEGGITALWMKSGKALYSSADSRLSAFLIRQGFHFYALQLATDIIFVSSYWSFKNPVYQPLPSILMLTIFLLQLRLLSERWARRLCKSMRSSARTTCLPVATRLVGMGEANHPSPSPVMVRGRQLLQPQKVVG